MTLLMSVMLYFLCLMILMPILFGLGGWAFDRSLVEIADIVGGNFMGPGDPALFRFLQGGGQLLTWGLTALLMAGILGNPAEELRLRVDTPFVLYVLAVFSVTLALPLVQASMLDKYSFQLPEAFGLWEEWVHTTEARSEKVLMQVLLTPEWEVFLANVLIFAVIPAITEEMFFRGFFQKQCYRLFNPHLAILFTALLFSLIHLQFYGFFSRFFLGILLGYLVWGSGNLIPAMLAHFTFNLVSIAAAYQMAKMGVSSEEAAPASISFPFLAVFSSLLALGGVLFFYLRMGRKYNLTDT